MDWSSLMPGLVHRVAGRLLDTADLDCYMALRAVCHNWRVATDDPTNTLDRRFRPHNWVMLDYKSHGEDARLLVNTATGRFHGRSIPMLRRAASRHLPTCVLNPFTDHMVRFAARMRSNVAAAVVSGSPPHYLVLYCHMSRKLYRASPDSQDFVRYKKKYAYPLVKKAVQGCTAIDGHKGLLPPLPAMVITKIAHLMTPFVAHLPDEEVHTDLWKRCFVVESAGETLVIFKLENRRMEVFKTDDTGIENTLQPVKSIGSPPPLFLGYFDRGISIDADKFPSIEANCIYFTEHINSPSTHIYHLKDGEEGPIGAAPSTNLPAFLGDPFAQHHSAALPLHFQHTELSYGSSTKGRRPHS
ncbi:hypothetical protein VPH35_048005 [Triticum aestivum]